jgi:hypothetical protein
VVGALRFFLCAALSLPLAGACSVLFQPEAGDGGAIAVDGSQRDGAAGDAAAADGMAGDGAMAGPCARRVSDVAHYPVDGDGGTAQLTDVGMHSIHGEVFEGSVKTTPSGAGPGCDEALEFEGQVHVVIRDDEAFHLATGSFEIFVRPVNQSSGTLVVVGRDQMFSNPGDLSLFQHRQESLGGSVFVLRIQTVLSEVQPGRGIYLCSHNVVPGTWYHVAANFGEGGVELYVDGMRAERVDQILISGEVHDCGSTSGEDPTIGIDELTEEHWRLGVGTIFEGGSNQTKHYAGGAIDDFRVSTLRFSP